MANKIRVFRMENGVRVPYVIEIDDELTVIEPPNMKPGDIPWSRVDAETKRREPLIAKKIGAWVSESVTVNPLPGTEELRAQYFKEKNELEARYAAEGTTCPNCKLGSLIKSYKEKLRQLGVYDSIT